MARDITGKAHWDSVYEGASQAVTGQWAPAGYEEKCLEQLLRKQIRGRNIRSILEVGCGNSTWLPYLARATGAAVTGIDYSARGCELAKANLVAAGVEGTIIQGDIFSPHLREAGQFDLVYSLGLVEHFDDLDAILGVLFQFVASGGLFLTEVPNLASVHGVLAYLYQPVLLARHRVISARRLRQAYESLGAKRVSSGLLGTISFGIVAWGIEPRYPELDPVILPVARLLTRAVHEVFSRVKVYGGLPLLAPFAFAVGEK